MPPPSAARLAVVLAFLAAPARAQDGLLVRARQSAGGMSPVAAEPAAKSQGLAASPERLWVFVVGILEWKDKASFGSFPKTDRRDAQLVDHFQRRLGVPADHIRYLSDAGATKAALAAGFDELLSKTREGDFLFFYYAGHGSRRKPGVTDLVPYDAKGGEVETTGWSVPAVFDAIEKGFKGSKVLLAADACYSGGMSVEAASRRGRVSYGVLASAESSSESTGNWTFTDALLRALRGEARVDLDGDGAVTFEELGRHAELEMAVAERQLPSWTATGSFDPKTKLAAVSRATPPPRTTEMSIRPFILDPQRPSGSKVDVRYEGKWYPAVIVDYKLGIHRVKYDGFEDYWDEWVSADRIRDR